MTPLLFLLGFFSQCVQAIVPTDMSQLPAFQPDYCLYTSSAQSIHYNAYTTALDMNQVRFDPAVGWNITTFELCNPENNVQDCKGTYHLEGRRAIDSQCLTCPYHLDPYWSVSNGSNLYSVYHEYENMFGPCFDKFYSARITCTQHPAMSPQGFVGVYHFPLQMPFTQAIWNQSAWDPRGVPRPIHTFLMDGASSDPWINWDQRQPKNPTSYGLGKQAVTDWLNTVQLINKTTGLKNEVLTNRFLRPFTTLNGVEQWLKWAQFFCYPGCHRDARYTIVRVRPSDIEGKPENFYLILDNEVARCTQCPPRFAAYDWNRLADAPFHPSVNLFASQCYPWFGALPTIVYDPNTGYNLKSVVISHLDYTQDGVVFPMSELVVDEQPCPVNTYNRVCTHTKKYYYRTGQMDKYHCTPCPPGYHTAGRTGQWYCHPPPGNRFTFEPLHTVPRVWANRDLLNRAIGFPELECGYLPSHCLQQPECGPDGMLPEDFNELYIFSKLLETVACPSGFYCPDAFTQIACPPERPWSPTQSFALANCSCRAGTYLSLDGLTCIDCTPRCTTPGTYLPFSQCMGKNGATADAPCAPCTNLPASNATSTGVGFEFLGSYGVCPFACNTGTLLLTQVQASSTCGSRFACQPVLQVPRNSQGQPLFYSYSSVLPTDGLLVDARNVICNKMLGLTSALNTLSATQWTPQLDTCYLQCTPNAQPCYALPVATGGFAATPWYNLTAPLACAPCPGAAVLPSSVLLQPYTALDQRLVCDPTSSALVIDCAQDEYYFNRSAWDCQSCRAREQLVCTANGTRLRGQGCLGVSTPFNFTEPAADCQRCTLVTPTTNRGETYLNYLSTRPTAAANGGCAIEPCVQLQKNFYWAIPCGGDRAGLQRPCSLSDCPAWQFQAAKCLNESDRVCTNCTTFRSGYRLTVSCGQAADSVWTLCASGFYCPGNGSELPCPSARTSQPGARTLNDCYCRVGTRDDSETTSDQCVPMQCPDTVQDPNLPGPSLVSAYYMTLDTNTFTSTACLPCGDPDALTQGTGLELTSCACPPGKYAALNLTNPKRDTIVCLPCVPRSCPAQLDSRKLPRPCARTFVAPQCECALPPFSALLSAQTVPGTECAAGCLAGYVPATSVMPMRSPLEGLPSVSGSMLYIEDTTPTAWTPLLVADANIAAFATTGELDDSALADPQSVSEFFFWSVQESPIVFAQRLPFPSATIPPPQWQVFGALLDQSGTAYAITHLAVSRWQSFAFPSTADSRDRPLYVGALVVGSGAASATTLSLSLTQFQLGTFTPNTTTTIPLLYSSTSASPPRVVGFQHCSAALGSSGASPSGGYFYVAYNLGTSACGGLVMISPTTGTVTRSMNPSFCTSGGNIPLRGFAVRVNPKSNDYPVAYVLLASGLYKLDTLQGTIPSQPLVPSFSSSLNTLTSLSSELLLSTSTTTTTTTTLMVTDIAQWTWVKIAGLPEGTAPSLPTIAATGINPTTTLLVVAYGPRLFRISAKQCPLNKYWDGVACVAHACVKLRQCDITQELVNNQCVCLPGYYQLAKGGCSACPIGSYCRNGQITPCPGTTLTTLDQYSTSVNDCICSFTGHYYSLAAADCVQCLPNTWCPNRWSILSCPSSTSSLTASSGNQFPVTCTCQPGFTGPMCAPCPANFYCPSSATPTTVYNSALVYTNLTSALAMPILIPSLLKYFNTPSTQLLLQLATTVQDLQRILYVADIAPTNHTPLPAIVVMLQLPSPAFQGWGMVLKLAFKGTTGLGYVGTIPTTAIPVQQKDIPNNVPTQCLTGKVPSAPIASTCVCAPGYEANGQQCKPCAANTFKTAPGSDTTCAPCPVGLVSLPASATCAAPAVSAPSNADAGGGGSTTVLIGAVVGGVVGLLVLLFIFQSFFLSHN